MIKFFLSKKTLPWILIGVFILVILALYLAKPKPARDFARPEARILVEVKPLEAVDYTPIIESYGLVEPLIQSQVVAQVGGRIIEVSEAFRDGGFFSRDDVLLRIDPADYKIEVAIAQAALAEAQRNLQEQQALAEQAQQDWQRLGGEREPSALTLREPQVASARASVASAEASVQKARLNLQRTAIVAPFDGRVLSKQVDMGQVVTPNTQLGTIYATNAVEIRLPVKNNDLPFLHLPERYRHDTQQHDVLPQVSIVSRLTQTETWQGNIVRTASAIDESSRQLYVVARIDDPFGSKAQGRFPLKIGQYVTAQITGNALPDVIVIPVSSIYQGSYVYLYRDGLVHRQPVQIAWQNDGQAVVSEGLQAGDQLVLSPLGQVNSGTPVKLNTRETQESVQGTRASHSQATKPAEVVP